MDQRCADDCLTTRNRGSWPLQSNLPQASPQHGPRVLLKPPPIHRSKLYQRRLQHRANSAAKLKLAGGAISQLGPEAKLAAFEQKLGRLKPVASC